MATTGSVNVCSFDGCSAVFKKPSKLEEHIRSHTGERPFACEEPGCEKTFTRKSHLARHGLSHSGVKQVRVNVCSFDGCSAVFKKPSKLEEHIRSHTGERPFACEEPGCEKTFTRKSHLARHGLSHSGVKQVRVNVCSFDGCSAVFKKPSKLEEHIRCHTGERPFACEEPGCEKTFTRKSHLARHGLSHSGVKQVRCTWAGCSDRFVNTTNLKKHIARKHKHEGKPYKCTHNDCGKGFQKHRQLRIHEYEHTGVLPFPCEKCNKRFLLPSQLNRHLKVHEGYSCRVQDCEATFDKWSVLQAHMKEQHPRKTSHKCDVCGKEFSMQCRLTQHALIHSPSRDVFPCPFNNCKRSYTKMSNLKTHIQSYHESRRPYSCTQQDCSKTFSHEISLRRHVKAVHDDKTSLPPRDRKSNYASRLTGYKEPKTTVDPQSQEEDSVDPALIHVAEELPSPDSSSEEMSEQEDVTCPDEETSTNSTIDELAGEQSPQIPSDEAVVDGCLVIGALETIDSAVEGVCMDVSRNDDTGDPRSCDETTEAKESDDRVQKQPSEGMQLRVINMATTGSVNVCSFDGCSAVFKKPSKLEEHIRSHTGERPFACEEPGCEKTFTRKSHLARHGLSHSGVKQVRCTWAGCSDQFVNTTNLKKHIAGKHKHEGKPYKCTHGDCGKGFQKHRQLRIHEYEHTGVLPFPCEKCNKRFLLPSKLNRHLKVHEGYSCRIQDCEATFDKWSVLQAHMREQHPRKTSHKCDVCGKEFSMQCRLTQHALIHSPSRDVFPCPFNNCKRSYTKMSNLKTHIQSYHESRRPYSCTQQDCDKTFSHEISLRRHLKAVHDDKTSLPPRDRKVGRKKSNYASRLTGYKEPKTTVDPPSEEEDSVDPALIHVAEELSTPDSSSEEMSEQEDVKCPEGETSIDSTIDELAGEQSPQKPSDEAVVEGSLVIGTLQTIDSADEGVCMDVSRNDDTGDPRSCDESTEAKESDGREQASEEVQLRVMA
ncbi:zinc finger protein 420-like isoform X2 [Branchiostoma lanceolatum]|uniref:zinc finger protein 420-like isoform X2 n=1 Tax=Branchiostoma lanceolatum TaxID=7740 RepID=UPI003451688A